MEFKYEGVDKAGKKVSGKLEAPNEGELRMILRGQGVRPTKVTTTAGAAPGGGAVSGVGFLEGLLSGGGVNVPIEAVVSFTRQIQILISSGIPLVQALEILMEQTADKNLLTVVTALRDKVSSGSYLWEALNAYPTVFPKLYVSLIRAGESSGSVDQMLKRLSRYLEDADRLKKMLKSAAMYPIMVVSIGVGVIALMLIFVIPKFEEMLKNGGQELPAPTQMLINMSHFLSDNMLVLGVGLGVSGFLFTRYTKSEEGRAAMDRLFFRMPMFGPLMQKGGVARFSRTLQTLLSSGVNLIDAVDICKATIDNAVLEEAVGKIRAEVEQGKTLGVVLTNISVFPRMAVQMISVGESTGNLDKMLEKVADFYEEEVETAIGGITKLIEPLVLVFLGGSVGGIMIAMYLPIFKLAGGVE